MEQRRVSTQGNQRAGMRKDEVEKKKNGERHKRVEHFGESDPKSYRDKKISQLLSNDIIFL